MPLPLAGYARATDGQAIGFMPRFESRALVRAAAAPPQVAARSALDPSHTRMMERLVLLGRDPLSSWQPI